MSTTTPTVQMTGVDGVVDCPVTIFPSDVYGVIVPPATRWDVSHGRVSRPALQLVHRVGDVWHTTPARHDIATIANLDDGAVLAIDFGSGWALDAVDTAAHRDHARRMIAAGVTL